MSIPHIVEDISDLWKHHWSWVVYIMRDFQLIFLQKAALIISNFHIYPRFQTCEGTSGYELSTLYKRFQTFLLLEGMIDEWILWEMLDFSLWKAQGIHIYPQISKVSTGLNCWTCWKEISVKVYKLNKIWQMYKICTKFLLHWWHVLKISYHFMHGKELWMIVKVYISRASRQTIDCMNNPHIFIWLKISVFCTHRNADYEQSTWTFLYHKIFHIFVLTEGTIDYEKSLSSMFMRDLKLL